MTARRKPWTVESTLANTAQLVLFVAGVVLVVNDHPGWGLYCFGAGWTVYVFALAQEHLNRIHPHEEPL